jgi:hypothetical protein
MSRSASISLTFDSPIDPEHLLDVLEDLLESQGLVFGGILNQVTTLSIWRDDSRDLDEETLDQLLKALSRVFQAQIIATLDTDVPEGEDQDGSPRCFPRLFEELILESAQIKTSGLM